MKLEEISTDDEHEHASAHVSENQAQASTKDAREGEEQELKQNLEQTKPKTAVDYHDQSELEQTSTLIAADDGDDIRTEYEFDVSDCDTGAEELEHQPQLTKHQALQYLKEKLRLDVYHSNASLQSKLERLAIALQTQYLILNGIHVQWPSLLTLFPSTAADSSENLLDGGRAVLSDLSYVFSTKWVKNLFEPLTPSTLFPFSSPSVLSILQFSFLAMVPWVMFSLLFLWVPKAYTSQATLHWEKFMGFNGVLRILIPFLSLMSLALLISILLEQYQVTISSAISAGQKPSKSKATSLEYLSIRPPSPLLSLSLGREFFYAALCFLSYTYIIFFLFLVIATLRYRSVKRIARDIAAIKQINRVKAQVALIILSILYIPCSLAIFRAAQPVFLNSWEEMSANASPNLATLSLQHSYRKIYCYFKAFPPLAASRLPLPASTSTFTLSSIYQPSVPMTSVYSTLFLNDKALSSSSAKGFSASYELADRTYLPVLDCDSTSGIVVLTLANLCIVFYVVGYPIVVLSLNYAVRNTAIAKGFFSEYFLVSSRKKELQRRVETIPPVLIKAYNKEKKRAARRQSKDSKPGKVAKREQQRKPPLTTLVYNAQNLLKNALGKHSPRIVAAEAEANSVISNKLSKPYIEGKQATHFAQSHMDEKKSILSHVKNRWRKATRALKVWLRTSPASLFSALSLPLSRASGASSKSFSFSSSSSRHQSAKLHPEEDAEPLKHGREIIVEEITGSERPLATSSKGLPSANNGLNGDDQDTDYPYKKRNKAEVSESKAENRRQRTPQPNLPGEGTPEREVNVAYKTRPQDARQEWPDSKNLESQEDRNAGSPKNIAATTHHTHHTHVRWDKESAFEAIATLERLVEEELETTRRIWDNFERESMIVLDHGSVEHDEQGVIRALRGQRKQEKQRHTKRLQEQKRKEREKRKTLRRLQSRVSRTRRKPLDQEEEEELDDKALLEDVILRTRSKKDREELLSLLSESAHATTSTIESSIFPTMDSSGILSQGREFEYDYYFWKTLFFYEHAIIVAVISIFDFPAVSPQSPSSLWTSSTTSPSSSSFRSFNLFQSGSPQAIQLSLSLLILSCGYGLLRKYQPYLSPRHDSLDIYCHAGHILTVVFGLIAHYGLFSSSVFGDLETSLGHRSTLFWIVVICIFALFILFYGIVIHCFIYQTFFDEWKLFYFWLSTSARRWRKHCIDSFLLSCVTRESYASQTPSDTAIGRKWTVLKTWDRGTKEAQIDNAHMITSWYSCLRRRWTKTQIQARHAKGKPSPSTMECSEANAENVLKSTSELKKEPKMGFWNFCCVGGMLSWTGMEMVREWVQRFYAEEQISKIEDYKEERSRLTTSSSAGNAQIISLDNRAAGKPVHQDGEAGDREDEDVTEGGRGAEEKVSSSKDEQSQSRDAEKIDEKRDSQGNIEDNAGSAAVSGENRQAVRRNKRAIMLSLLQQLRNSLQKALIPFKYLWLSSKIGFTSITLHVAVPCLRYIISRYVLWSRADNILFNLHSERAEEGGAGKAASISSILIARVTANYSLLHYSILRANVPAALWLLWNEQGKKRRMDEGLSANVSPGETCRSELASKKAGNDLHVAPMQQDDETEQLRNENSCVRETLLEEKSPGFTLPVLSPSSTSIPHDEVAHTMLPSAVSSITPTLGHDHTWPVEYLSVNVYDLENFTPVMLLAEELATALHKIEFEAAKEQAAEQNAVETQGPPTLAPKGSGEWAANEGDLVGSESHSQRTRSETQTQHSPSLSMHVARLDQLLQITLSRYFRVSQAVWKERDLDRLSELGQNIAFAINKLSTPQEQGRKTEHGKRSNSRHTENSRGREDHGTARLPTPTVQKSVDNWHSYGRITRRILCRIFVGNRVTIDLSHENLGLSLGRLLSDEIGCSGKNIKSLNLSNCNLDNECALVLAQSFMAEGCPLLTFLNLSENKFKSSGGIAIATAIRESQKYLRQLSLASNLLGPQVVRYFFTAYNPSNPLSPTAKASPQRSNPRRNDDEQGTTDNQLRLQFLDLSGNQLGETIAYAASQVLSLSSRRERAIRSQQRRQRIAKLTDEQALHDEENETSCLLSLSIGSNSITRNGCLALYSSLKHNSSLTALQMRNSSIGDGFAALVSALTSKVSSLTSLDIRNHRLGPQGGSAIASALKVNSSLIYLDIGDNRLGGDGGIKLAQALSSNVSLTALKAEGNQFGQAAGEALGFALQKNSVLISLSLARNNLGSSFGIQLSHAISPSPEDIQLKQMFLQQTEILCNHILPQDFRLNPMFQAEESKERKALEGKVFRLVIDTYALCIENPESRMNVSQALFGEVERQIDHIKMLAYEREHEIECMLQRKVEQQQGIYRKPTAQLDVEVTSHIFDRIAQELTSMLQASSSLETIDISNNNLGPKAVKALSSALMRRAAKSDQAQEKDLSAGPDSTVSVITLNMSGNKAGEEAGESLAGIISNPDAKLQELGLSHGHIGLKTIKFIADSLFGNKTIETLDISSNKLSDEAGIAIFSSLARNQALRKLNMEETDLQEASGKALASAILMNTTLEEINLGKNRLGNTGGIALVENIRLNRRLKYLNLSENGFTAEIGYWLAAALRESRSLTSIDLSNNSLGVTEEVVRNMLELQRQEEEKKRLEAEEEKKRLEAEGTSKEPGNSAIPNSEQSQTSAPVDDANTVGKDAQTPASAPNFPLEEYKADIARRKEMRDKRMSTMMLRRDKRKTKVQPLKSEAKDMTSSEAQTNNELVDPNSKTVEALKMVLKGNPIEAITEPPPGRAPEMKRKREEEIANVVDDAKSSQGTEDGSDSEQDAEDNVDKLEEVVPAEQEAYERFRLSSISEISIAQQGRKLNQWLVSSMTNNVKTVISLRSDPKGAIKRFRTCLSFFKLPPGLRTLMGTNSRNPSLLTGRAIAKTLLRKNSAIKMINLSHNSLGKQDIFLGRWFARVISSPFCILRALGLGGNDLGPQSGGDIIASLAENKTITYLDLGNNALGQAAGKSMAQVLMVNDTIRTLNLEKNELRSSGIEIIRALAANPTITAIDLSDNDMGPYACAELSDLVAKNLSLKSLDLGGNGLGSAGSERTMVLTKILEKNRSLTVLDLYENRLGSRVVSAMADVLARDNKTLLFLGLTSNQLDFSAGQALARAVQRNDVITCITADQEEIGRENAIEIHQTLKSRV